MTGIDGVPRWPELIILMCFGESEEQPFTGVLEVDDRYGDEDDEADLPRTVRVHKSGSRYRVETLDGEVLYIKGFDRSWRFTPGHEAPGLILQEDDEEYERGSYGYAVGRPSPTNWRGDDFTTPTGPARATIFLGRGAWEIELAPPSHKPAAVTLIIDATTGMQLRWGTAQFGDVFRWTEIAYDVELADDIFTWEGPSAFAYGDPAELPDDIREAVERSNAERAEKIKGLRVPNLTIERTAEPELFDVADDGAFHATFDFEGYVTVERRPHSDSAWEGDDVREFSAWTEAGWDWRARSSDGIGSDQLAEIRRQLAEPPPDS